MDSLIIFAEACALLTNPALALEYKENRTLTPDEMKEKLHIMHTSVYNQYAAQLEGGDGQLLNKMKTFWEYLAPNADRKLMKAIHKSTSLSKYNQAIQAFLVSAYGFPYTPKLMPGL